VITPDARGSGRSVHGGGPIPYTLLADDVAALIEALKLDQPLVCGFSDGGETATITGIRHPGSVRAIVNHAGYDLFNPHPHAPSAADHYAGIWTEWRLAGTGTYPGAGIPPNRGSPVCVSRTAA